MTSQELCLRGRILFPSGGTDGHHQQQIPTHNEVIVARQRPLTGALLGIVIGIAVAVLLQQQGVWPLDKITVFLLPAATGVIGLVITSVRSEEHTSELQSH